MTRDGEPERPFVGMAAVGKPLLRLRSEDPVHARAHGSHGKVMRALAKSDLLIHDEWASLPWATATGGICSNSWKTERGAASH